MMLFRARMGMLPKTVAAEMPSRFKRHSMSSKKRVNCEKTKAWNDGEIGMDMLMKTIIIYNYHLESNFGIPKVAKK